MANFSLLWSDADLSFNPGCLEEESGLEYEHGLRIQFSQESLRSDHDPQLRGPLREGTQLFLFCFPYLPWCGNFPRTKVSLTGIPGGAASVLQLRPLGLGFLWCPQVITQIAELISFPLRRHSWGEEEQGRSLQPSSDSQARDDFGPSLSYAVSD